jgi:hypothetical protein
MRAIHVVFYRPSADDHWLNHAVTRFAPPYSHCDLQFDTGVATSIYQNECVYMQPKTFSRANYDRVSFTLDETEYERVFNFCKAACDRKVRFDMLGMLCSTLPFVVRSPQNATFCSRYVLEALQQSGNPKFSNHRPMTTTPSSLHDALNGLTSNFIHIPDIRISKLVGQLV